MYFFQDDIGLLLQHQAFNFWQFLIFPQAEHFAPVLHLLTYLEFTLFHLNFYGYFFVSLSLHLINVFILYKIVRYLKLKNSSAVIISALFLINLTFTEPLLWFSAQGVVLANIFIALSFYFWLKKSPLIYFSLIAASFSFSTGLGLGIIFGTLTLLAGRFNPDYFLLGIIPVLIGPLVAGSTLGRIMPVIDKPFIDFLLFMAFILGGVGRGVFGRLFLPGFEPRHFELIKTAFSFMPFALISAITAKLIISKNRKLRVLPAALAILIFYPYIWAGAIRYQFGIKQALAERYAYTPLFFSIIMLGLILKYFSSRKIVISRHLLALFVFIILILQSINFHKKAVEFEKRPLLTKKYIKELKFKFSQNEPVVDGPLPVFINQPFKVHDLFPLLGLN